MARSKRPRGNPWRAARARVWFNGGVWFYVVTNWDGKVVESDFAGGDTGRNTIFTQAAVAVAAHRHIDGIGQGKHLKEKHVWQPHPDDVQRAGMAKSTWPELFPEPPLKRRRSFSWKIGIPRWAE